LFARLSTREFENCFLNWINSLVTVSGGGCTVTIDAMGTQKKIAEQIHNQGGNDVLAVKENQQKLYKDE